MKRLLTSFFGFGFLPLAPGSWASLPIAAIFAFMCHLGIEVFWITVALVFLIVCGAVICVKFTPYVIALTGKNDPGEIVADEVSGQAMTFLFLPSLAGKEILLTAICGFLIFRLFDIVKPWPIHKIEKLPAGWGVLCDDLMAGVFSAVLLQLCVRLWIEVQF